MSSLSVVNEVRDVKLASSMNEVRDVKLASSMNGVRALLTAAFWYHHNVNGLDRGSDGQFERVRSNPVHHC